MVGWSFAHMPRLMPIERLHETDQVVAFYHPAPIHPTHILIVPKRPIRSVVAIAYEDLGVVRDVLTAVRHLVSTLALDAPGYRLEVNGGANQEVAQLHFHLVSAKPR